MYCFDKKNIDSNDLFLCEMIGSKIKPIHF